MYYHRHGISATLAPVARSRFAHYCSPGTQESSVKVQRVIGYRQAIFLTTEQRTCVDIQCRTLLMGITYISTKRSKAEGKKGKERKRREGGRAINDEYGLACWRHPIPNHSTILKAVKRIFSRKSAVLNCSNLKSVNAVCAAVCPSLHRY